MSLSKLNKEGWMYILGSAFGVIIMGAIYYLAAGKILPQRIWLFLIVTFIYFFGSSLYVGIKNPGLMNARGAWKKKKDAKQWDVLLVKAFFFLSFVIVPLTAGLEYKVLGTAFGVKAGVWGFILYTAGHGLLHWAMVANTHFETVVRIQKDRKHKVIQTGPYKIVRHPGYTGILLFLIGGPLFLGSLYSFIPAVLSAALMIYRTNKEDNTLKAELKGYINYARKVHYRLLPLVW